MRLSLLNRLLLFELYFNSLFYFNQSLAILVTDIDYPQVLCAYQLGKKFTVLVSFHVQSLAQPQLFNRFEVV